MRQRNNYSREKVRGLVEEHEALREKADVTEMGLVHLVQLIDLERSLPLLTLKQRQAIFLMGTVGISVYHAARILGVPTMTCWRRYQHALTVLTEVLNKGGL